MADAPRPWFPAKRYGWGWGPPSTWQGWAVLAAYGAVLILGIAVLGLKAPSLAFYGFVAGATAVLVAVMWLKGERPRWRWGGD